MEGSLEWSELGRSMAFGRGRRMTKQAEDEAPAEAVADQLVQGRERQPGECLHQYPRRQYARSADVILQAWKHYLLSPMEDEFSRHWGIMQREFAHQAPILNYLR